MNTDSFEDLEATLRTLPAGVEELVKDFSLQLLVQLSEILKENGHK